MKVKTFRNILLVICAAYIGLIYWNPISFEQIFFDNWENTIYEYWEIRLFVTFFLAVPAFISASIFFKENKYNVMTKRGIAVFSLVFAILILVPYYEYLPRTEITAETITKHNLIGQVTKVYEFEDAKKVTVGLTSSVHGGVRHGASAYLHFVYSVEFEDGYSYDFGGSEDSEKWNKIVDSVNKTVKDKGIEKQVIGETYLELDTFDAVSVFNNYFDSIYPDRPRIEELMYN
ncbi:MAG: hypothetical protein UHM85_04135 [Acutalibacteraceae bacterium]|nr:hypothetical protein [Acutalibacteraceae bacterium]